MYHVFSHNIGDCSQSARSLGLSSLTPMILYRSSWFLGGTLQGVGWPAIRWVSWCSREASRQTSVTTYISHNFPPDSSTPCDRKQSCGTKAQLQELFAWDWPAWWADNSFGCNLVLFRGPSCLTTIGLLQHTMPCGNWFRQCTGARAVDERKSSTSEPEKSQMTNPSNVRGFVQVNFAQP